VDERGTAERVLALLGLLQLRQVWTGPELADRLGVTTRTVRRDVERLRTPRLPGARERGRFPYPSGDEMRRRRVEPYRLVASDRRWYLLAYDLDRDDWRTFRVDRMADVAPRSWRYRPREDAPDAAAYVQESVASRVYPHRARFLVRAPPDTVREQVPPSAAVVRALGDESCEVLSGGGNLDSVLLHVLLLGHDFEVLDPPELRDRCRALAERLLAAGKSAAPKDARV
jgi:predicted DNA-binding transcriptional regulator YafY